jgi:acetyltransferase-like isoleucine patch superfamily enzyme
VTFRIFNFLFSISRRNGKKSHPDYISIGKDSNIDNLKIQMRKKGSSSKRIIVGDNTIVHGDFIFEKETGQISIGDRTFIGGGLFISIDSIFIGNDVMFSWGCTVIDNDAHALESEKRTNDVMEWKKGIEENKIGFYKNWNAVVAKPVVIKDNAWIGFNSIILKGVTIGKGAVVGAGSVVTRSVPDFAIVAGNPAKLIRYTK